MAAEREATSLHGERTRHREEVLTSSLRAMRVSAARWSAVKSAANRRHPAALIATVGALAPPPPYFTSCGKYLPQRMMPGISVRSCVQEKIAKGRAQCAHREELCAGDDGCNEA